MTAKRTHVYTDGACSGNPGPGGWAWVVSDGRQATGGDPDTTNQRMELKAVLEALDAIEGPVTVHSDSTYVVNCYRDRWFDGWLQRGWRTSGKKPVANRDLWEPLVAHFQARADELELEWVKGHSGDPMNDLADALAVAEVEALKASNRAQAPGPTVAADLGPEAPWPVDQAIAVTGGKQLDDDLAEALAEAVHGLDPANDVLVSGLRRGPELEAAEEAVRVGLPLGVVLPFPDPAARWPAGERARFDAALASAQWVVELAGDPGRPGKAVAERDAWTWRSVVGAIIVDGADLVDQLEELGLGIVEIPA